MKSSTLPIMLAAFLAVSFKAEAEVISFEAADFEVNPSFSNIQTFGFIIDLAGPLTAGASYSNPTLNSVIYNVSGILDATPSGFPAFNLQRTISGSDFYNQGSSLSFTISAQADLSDGLQVSELTAVSGAPVFVFDGREVDTGRYHPALVELYADGSASIRNSNNTGGVNPGSGMVVDVDFGDEYITDLIFNSLTLTLFHFNDLDKDGVQDAADNCPLIPNPDQINFDSADDGGDACDTDDDNDDWLDVDDNCPKIHNPFQENTNGSSRGDACYQLPLGC